MDDIVDIYDAVMLFDKNEPKRIDLYCEYCYRATEFIVVFCDRVLFLCELHREHYDEIRSLMGENADKESTAPS